MSNEVGARTILAIESAIEGGSIVLMRELELLDSIVGDRGVSRAEDLLPNISELLEKNSLKRSEIDMIAVSSGPGSYTGIRIGLATALGLKTALDIPIVGIAALEAMANATDRSLHLLTAVPVGKTDVCVQEFNREGVDLSAVTEPVMISEAEFADHLRTDRDFAFVLPTSLIERFGLDNPAITAEVIDIGRNIAYLVGLMAAGPYQRSEVVPIFVEPRSR